MRAGRCGWVARRVGWAPQYRVVFQVLHVCAILLYVCCAWSKPPSQVLVATPGRNSAPFTNLVASMSGQGPWARPGQPGHLEDSCRIYCTKLVDRGLSWIYKQNHALTRTCKCTYYIHSHLHVRTKSCGSPADNQTKIIPASTPNINPYGKH